ncbi:MAG: hypothetical protein IPI59_12550 [Sphingobacteriales bacterium]|nr:hypothetical protein [Sphingobacteriales bacterium]MBP9140876.1 hypothetical protein [Chitinophagales bacterium]MDA0197590.1 DUF6265 family protein [Bacteroidota bacterium]MBK6889139.1 hypothetical protein [Sphingobacteriales bacterium]MBK7528357.1 hypothetical protein [Sphingobacteriales bacterium]
MSKHPSHIDDLFKENQHGFDQMPREAVWQRLEELLDGVQPVNQQEGQEPVAAAVNPAVQQTDTATAATASTPKSGSFSQNWFKIAASAAIVLLVLLPLSWWVINQSNPSQAVAEQKTINSENNPALPHEISTNANLESNSQEANPASAANTTSATETQASSETPKPVLPNLNAPKTTTPQSNAKRPSFESELKTVPIIVPDAEFDESNVSRDAASSSNTVPKGRSAAAKDMAPETETARNAPPQPQQQQQQQIINEYPAAAGLTTNNYYASSNSRYALSNSQDDTNDYAGDKNLASQEETKKDTKQAKSKKNIESATPEWLAGKWKMTDLQGNAYTETWQLTKNENLLNGTGKTTDKNGKPLYIESFKLVSAKNGDLIYELNDSGSGKKVSLQGKTTNNNSLVFENDKGSYPSRIVYQFDPSQPNNLTVIFEGSNGEKHSINLTKY